MSCLIFTSAPSNFQPRVEVASCYCEFENQLLVLKRHPRKSQGNTWGVPAGKLEAGEEALSAIKRELFEEIGLVISKDQLIPIKKLYIRQAGLDFIYHMFYLHFEHIPQIVLGLEEHQEAKWVSIEEALQMPLMSGEAETIEYYRQFKLRTRF